MAKARAANTRNNVEPSGLWHQPASIGLLADLLIVAGVAGIAWAGLQTLQRMPLFPLREIALSAQPQRVAPEQIAHVARTNAIGNFFTVDLEALRAAFEELPWVRKATVRRHWPHGLVLTLDEHEAVALWQPLNGDIGFVNRQGEVFRVELPEDIPALPRLTGPEGAVGELHSRYAEMSRALAALGRRVETVALTPRGSWRVRLDDGVVVDLGRNQENQPLSLRIERLATHYNKVKNQLDGVRVVDMRYRNGFALSGAVRAGKPVAAGRKS